MKLISYLSVSARARLTLLSLPPCPARCSFPFIKTCRLPPSPAPKEAAAAARRRRKLFKKEGEKRERRSGKKKSHTESRLSSSSSSSAIILLRALHRAKHFSNKSVLYPRAPRPPPPFIRLGLATITRSTGLSMYRHGISKEKMRRRSSGVGF